MYIPDSTGFDYLGTVALGLALGFILHSVI
jgi:hypothetical protein